MFQRSIHKPAEALIADGRFHDALLANCPNTRLMDLIARQKLLVRRYELIYFNEPRFFERSAEQHESVIDGLAPKDLKASALALRENWTCGLDLLIWRVEDGGGRQSSGARGIAAIRRR